MKLLGKTYEPQNIEDGIYKEWMEKGYFHAEVDETKKPFTIVIPPPNITGQLHMGHALNNTLQDVVIRMKRMQGYSALWLPGTDHASIATEAKIVEAMKEEGISKADIGREGFLKRAWEWNDKYGSRIVEQLKRLGSSCDWDRLRFTMDDGLSKAVTTVFVRLYEKGLVYKGERIINWCPVCNTSISDAEVEYSEKEGSLWHIRYPIKDSTEFVTVATTRPETMLGDTAIAVHPDDDRYRHLVGKTVILPLMDREIPIVADEYVEKDFGTGMVKVTPAHDPNDFEIGERHNLPIIKVINDDATMGDSAGRFAGLDRYEARKKIVAELEQSGLLIKTDRHVHNVGACYRCDTVIEPLVSLQWFVKMEGLAKPAVESVLEGDIKFIPDRFVKTYLNWMDNIKDWCISRQLWWGHRIPAYYCDDCNEVIVSVDEPGECPKCKGSNLRQDEDTLDTWFSSALWPFSTLGWPEETPELGYFYPTNVLITGYDIIFFWVARMIFSGLEYMGQRPFEYVMFTGLVRDELGRKMSKSLGNGIDPIDVIETFGTDALRYGVMVGNATGNDLRLSEQKLQAGRNFANKIWNAARFVLMNFDDEPDLGNIAKDNFTDADKWILSRLNKTIAEVTANLEKFEIGIALSKVYEFIWEEFCDWYIELVKPRLYDKESEGRLEAQYVLNKVLCDSMKLLHPFMPFVTEEIYKSLINDDESIMVSSWPEYSDELIYEKEEDSLRFIMDAIRGIRNARAEMSVPPSRKARLIFVSKDDVIRKLAWDSALYFAKLANVSEVDVRENEVGIPKGAVSVVMDGAALFIPLTDLLDIEKEMKRLEDEAANLEKEIARAEGKLSNEKFTSKAPAELVESEREKLRKYTDMLKETRHRIDGLREI
ncbi:MAG TPA: valine--tRNA ligase [Clostridia bacterium]|nr:valine--tRNA ligase [Clostridia bacterium]